MYGNNNSNNGSMNGRNNRNSSSGSRSNKARLQQLKTEAANSMNVDLKQGYNGDLTSRQAGSVGGQMVKKMIQKYENDIK